MHQLVLDPNTQGTILDIFEYRIDSPDENGVGEIVVKGPSVMLGYYKDEEATNEVLKDGYFYTGDLGYIDEKNNLFITGRKKDIIVLKSGKKIFPEEIEYLLNQNPAIKESLVYSFVNEDTNETQLKAIIVTDYETIVKELRVSQDDYDTFLNLITNAVADVNKATLSYKQIVGFKIRETEFEKTTTRKIKRFSKENIGE